MTAPAPDFDAAREAVTITEFLEARIAEDEAAAREVETDFEFDSSSPLRSALDVYAPGYDTSPVISIDSTRVLAECAAKRAIIQYVTGLRMDQYRDDETNAQYRAAWWIAVQLAKPYADHPDHQQEWKP